MFRFLSFSLTLLTFGAAAAVAQEPALPMGMAEETPQEAAASLAARPDEEVLVPSLEHLDIVGDASLPPPDNYDTPVFLNEAPPVLETDGFVAVLGEFLFRPISRESLDRMRNSVRLYLASMGYPFSLVYWPEQDITDGRLRLVVRSSQVGRIEVQGNRWFSTDSYLHRFGLRPGDPLNQYALRLGSDALNLSEYRNVSVKLKRGTEPGTSDVIIIAQDRKPWQVHAGFANTGTLTTGENRLSGGFTWGDLLGSDHSISANWSSDPSARYSRSLYGTYAMPVGTDVDLSLFGAWSRTRAKVAAPFKQEGTSWQVGFNYDRDLGAVGQRYQHGLQMGLDFKSSDNNLDYILPPIVFPITGNLTEVVQARLQYQGTLHDSLGYTRGSIRLVASPGNITTYNDDEAFSQTRAFATADYIYARANLFRGNTLSGVFEGWNWTLRGSLQLATGNLLGSEQFSAGGAHTVRGYPEGSIIGDNGLLFSQELLLPALNPVSKLFGTNIQDQLRVFTFHDYARTWNVDQLPGEEVLRLHSVGFGLRYQFSHYASISLAHGWQLVNNPSISEEDNHRFHFSIQASY